MEYKDMVYSTVLIVAYNHTFEATRFLISSKRTKESTAIDLDTDSLLKLVNQLNEIIENQEDQTVIVRE